MRLTDTLAERIAGHMRRDGYECIAADVWSVWRAGTLYERESLASAILQEFEELGIEVPA